MQLFILEKGTGKTGKPIKGQWDASKKRYIYTDPKGKKRQKKMTKLVLAEGSEIPRSLRQSPYMRVKPTPSYTLDPDAFHNVRSTRRPFLQAQEYGARLDEYKRKLALLSPEDQQAVMSDAMESLVSRMQEQAGGKDVTVETPKFTKKTVKKILAKRDDPEAGPLTPTERQILMEHTMQEQRRSVIDERKNVKKSIDLLLIYVE